MTEYRRPWWLIVNKSKGLITTVREEYVPGEQIFVIRGEPLVQGLAWLIWGPIGAVVTAMLLAWLAMAFQVKEQPAGVKILFITLFVMLPTLVWGGIVLVTLRFSRKHLQAARQAEAQECVIRLNQRFNQLFFRTTSPPVERSLAFSDIQQARVTRPIGRRNSARALLTLNTNEGAIVLLDELLGTQAQKSDLALRIQQALERTTRD